MKSSINSEGYNIKINTLLVKYTSRDASCKEQENAVNIGQQNDTVTKSPSHSNLTS